MATSVLMKPASGQCNMHCDYCFYCDEMAKRGRASYGFMETATLQNIIRRTELAARDSISFAFQGGEPTLRGLDFYRRAVRYQKQYNHSGLRITNAFQTNGLLLDEEWARFFRENHFLAGVSLDGTRTIHDRFRHTADLLPTYDTVVSRIGMLRREQVEFNILTVVTRPVAQNIETIYREYQRRGWNYQQYIPCLAPLGQPNGEAEWSLLPQDYGEMLVKLFDLWYADLLQGRQPYIRQFENWIAIAAGMMPEACDQRGICGIQYVVEADGSCYPCDFYMIDPWKLGNFNEDSLTDMDNKRVELGFVERSRHLPRACLNCPYLTYCRGGCQRMRNNTAEGWGANDFCESFRMFFKACLPRLRRVAAELAGRY